MYMFDVNDEKWKRLIFSISVKHIVIIIQFDIY